jgi:hypothetical protein
MQEVDIVEFLRNPFKYPPRMTIEVFNEAADEIERLREALKWISNNDIEADSEYQPHGVKPRRFALKARAALSPHNTP